MQAVRQLAERLIQNVEQVIFGKRDMVELLVEDVPGVGKTMLAKALARSLGGSFKRIQFTPDMLPSDVTGTSIYNQKTGDFEFRPGPIMAQIVLADEITRATPKTQAALLEAMEERQVTVDGVTYKLGPPFLVLATQNPIEYEGTFPLPEAQLDRFLMRISLGYPTPEQEMAILDAQQLTHPIEKLKRVTTVEEVVAMQEALKSVYADKLIKEYIVALVDATRRHPDVYLGASPRGALTLFRTAQARAAIHGRDYVIPDDVKALAPATLSHRIIISPAARLRGIAAGHVLDELLRTTPVPGARVK